MDLAQVMVGIPRTVQLECEAIDNGEEPGLWFDSFSQSTDLTDRL
jgi:hypothetical protein